MIGEHGPAPHGEELLAGSGSYGDGVIEGLVPAVAGREVDVAKLLVDGVERQVRQRVLISGGDADFDASGADDVIAGILRVAPAGVGRYGDESVSGVAERSWLTGAEGDADDVGPVRLNGDGAALALEDEGLS